MRSAYIFSIVLYLFFNQSAKGQDSTWTGFQTGSSDLPHNHVTDVVFESEKVNWVATWGGGLARYNDEWTVFDTSNSALPTNLLNDLEFDTDGQLWIGTNGKGLCKYNVDGFQNFDISKNNIVLCLFAENPNKVWVGTYTEGLYIVEHGLVRKVWGDKDGLQNTIHDILKDQEGNIWFSTIEGIFKFQDDLIVEYNLETPGLDQSQSFALEMDSKGNIWAAMLPRGELAMFDGEKWKYHKEPMNVGIRRKAPKEGLRNYGFSFTISDDDQILLAGLQTAPLLRYNGNAWIPLNIPEEIAEIRPGIALIDYDLEKNLWIGTWKYGCIKIDREHPTDVHWTAKKTLDVERFTEIQFATKPRDSTIKILLWDDGKLDGDVVSIKLNDQWVLKDYKLTRDRLELDITFDPSIDNFLLLHAENLGAVPPNTCAMLLVDGGSRKKFQLSSDETTSGVIHLKKR